MSDTGPAPATQPSRLTLLLVALGLFLIGLLMTLHGLGIVDAAWANPNPQVPAWIFTIIGAILLLAAWLSIGKIRALPKAAYNIAGWLIVALSILVMHWLIFFAEGASCSIDTLTLSLGLPGDGCKFIMGGMVILLDGVLVLVALATLRTWWRR